MLRHLRRTPIAVLLAIGVLAGTAAVAYAVINTYIVRASITPAKPGTRAHPRPVQIVLQDLINAEPNYEIPAITKTVRTSIFGIQGATNSFPACGTSRLISPGPGSCPRGSLAGTGYAYFWAYPAGRVFRIYAKECRLEISIYNGGNGTLSFYVFKGPRLRGQPPPCALARPVSFVVPVQNVGSGLIETVTLPTQLRHPAGYPPTSWSMFTIHMFIPIKTRVIGTRRHHHTVALFSSFACPANHQRQVAVTFTTESGQSTTETRNVACR